jgi:glycosyltransferase involved in cell wall biosynthesis
VSRLISAADVLVLPSVVARNGDSEGLGMVLLEAAASGVPVIGTLHGGIPEVVVDGKTGLLVPERSVGKLAEALTYLAADCNARTVMGAAARSLVLSKFNAADQAAKLEALYREVA